MCVYVSAAKHNKKNQSVINRTSNWTCR